MIDLQTLRHFVATLIAASPRKIALTAIVMLSLSLTEGMGLLLLVPLLQLVGVDAAGASGSRASLGLSAAFSWAGLRPTLGAVLGIYVAIAVCQSFLQRWHTMLNAEIRLQVEAFLRMRLYRALGRARWLFIARSRTSDFSQMLTQELDRIGLAAHDLIDLAVGTLIALVYVGIALRVSPQATVFVLACGGGLAWTLRRRVSDSHELGVAMSVHRADLHAAVTEHLGSMKTARCYGAVDRHDTIFSALTENLRAGNLSTVASYARLRQQTVVGSAIVLAIIVYVSRALIALPTAHLLMLLFLFARLMPRLSRLLEGVQGFGTVLPAYGKFHALETRCLVAAEPVGQRRQPIAFTREIRLDGVSFTYDNGTARPAVSQIGMVIRAGATTAIVGPSGGGKSTLADLLLGLLVPSEGAILVDGVPLDPALLEAWRDQIGYVNQDTFLFHDTVRANLLWARPDATENDLRRVLRMAAADEFVARLPRGLDTILGDRGVLVSGGERQRLALARALLRRPNLLILDEATNALDSENEARIQQAIDGLRHQMTIVLITHRLSTIRAAEAIYVVDEGRIVESGTWAELLASPRSRFVQLSRAQQVKDLSPPELMAVGRETEKAMQKATTSCLSH